MAVIGRAAAALGVKVNRDDSRGVSADDIGAHHIADVNRRRRGDPGVPEGGMENRWIWFCRTYLSRVDDPGDDRSSP